MIHNITKYIPRMAAAIAAVAFVAAPDAMAQQPDDNASSSSSTVTRRRPGAREAEVTNAGNVTPRMQQRFQQEAPSDADMQWMRVIYRQIDLTKDANTPLYFPEEPVDGQESLFRIIMRLLANDQIEAFEYLDGREVFTDQYRIKVKDMLDRYHIYYTDAKGSSEKHPKFNIEESDVPANEVLSYYVVERWEFDRRHNQMTSRIEAICPVLHRAGDFGGEAVKYPMFWLRFNDLRPFLSTQNIFVTDDNNLATCTYDDYFALGMYDGEIYKTRNLRNRSMAQLYPDPDDMKRAQDSIQQSLDNFDKKLWVPSLDELAARREAAEAAELAAAGADTTSVGEASPAPRRSGIRARRGNNDNNDKAKRNKPAKVKRAKAPKSSGSSGATRSVRNRRR